MADFDKDTYSAVPLAPCEVGIDAVNGQDAEATEVSKASTNTFSKRLAVSLAERPQDDDLRAVDYIKLASAFVLPGTLALSVVIMPFGNPFARDGPNSLAENWAYYFWYTPIGWAGMWLKMCLWNCELFDVEFCFPFMQGRPGIFKFNGSLLALTLATAFATGAYVAGYKIFQNPVPFGTISFGVPCFVATFICMYFCIVPTEFKQTFTDHMKLVRCWIPFVLFIVALCVYMACVWVQTFVISEHEDMRIFFFGNLLVQLAFIAVRELFASIPVQSLMGCQHWHLAMLWNLGYGAICSSMSDWIFPGMPTHAVGLCTVGCIMATNFFMTLAAVDHQVKKQNVTGLLAELMNCICDVISGWAFLFIFSYNAFGPNQKVIYMIASFSHRQKVEAVCMILVNLAVNLLKVLFAMRMLRQRCDERFQAKVWQFCLLSLRQWYWLVLWLLVSTCLTCGACMVMMHDGMDFTFTFQKWYGTWPFVQE